MKRKAGWVLAAVLMMAALGSCRAQGADDELLRVRESVWRAFFADDVAALERLVPPETVVISSGEKEWKRQPDVMKSAADLHAKGGKLIRLEFPRTEVQHFGDVAIIYSQYLYELEVGGQRSVSAGRVTEIFVRRNGGWVNPGWHTDEEK